MATRKTFIESELLLLEHRRGKPGAFEKLVEPLEIALADVNAPRHHKALEPDLASALVALVIATHRDAPRLDVPGSDRELFLERQHRLDLLVQCLLADVPKNHIVFCL